MLGETEATGLGYGVMGLGHNTNGGVPSQTDAGTAVYGTALGPGQVLRERHQ